ncbi:CLIP-associated protein-like isoform X1 [Zingiber officinale]|uniref:CLIP-associated protein-like isoform X1 n=2 Tax=Zingiber officinale TaxID=94328 RepID=UPI001C4C8635|nr:CLIP-associated protein-like isoform X1 [Zingiber officinale]
MEVALEMVRVKDAKERMAGVERLRQVLEATTRGLSAGEVTALVDACIDLLKDSNFRVSQGALQSLSAAAVLSGENLKVHFNGLVPAVVERLGDGKQSVRDAARQLLITLMEVSSPTIIVERVGSYAWTHRSWRVREEFARTVTTAIRLFASTELPLQRVLLPPVLQLLNDSNQGVREAATSCIEEMYAQVGPQFREELHRHHLPSSMIKEINARLEQIQPKPQPSDRVGISYFSTEIRPSSANHKKNSPKAKIAHREISVSSGDNDSTEKPVVPINVFSEKELIKEIENIASTLVPEKDWSFRIAAMQKVEGLVFGGAADYTSFPTHLKQLIVPLNTQLLDRRSSIVKQACHLLRLLSKELMDDFEACAEIFIPVLMKLVVITVLVIAESADNCIKTMLRNCKVARVLPRIADAAKNDKSAVLRARCCEYALLILEYWADAPELQRSADLYEDLIKCCVADAMSEVRSTARTCYWMFTKTWPERSRRLFLSFDPVIQRMLNEENGGMNRRYSSPSLLEKGAHLSHSPSQSMSTSIPGYSISAIVAMDKTSAILSGTSVSSSSLVSKSKSLGKNSKRSLESVLHASKQKVLAIESLLKGISMSEKKTLTAACSTSLDLAVDSPSTHDKPLTTSVSSNSFSMQSSPLEDSTITNIGKDGNRNGGLNMSDLVSQVQLSRDQTKLSFLNHDTSDSLSLPSSYLKRSCEQLQDGSVCEDNVDHNLTRQLLGIQTEKCNLETPSMDSSHRDSQNLYVPNFRRPLLRKQVTGRGVANARNSFDDSQILASEMSSYIDGPETLGDALSEGLSPSSDWVARVCSFNYLWSLLQQGPKGVLEVTQNFEKVMKLFFRYLDDPHHKVAQATFVTLAEIISTCRKPFENYLERTLPRVFARLIDPKELVRQPCSVTLEIIGKTYNIDSLLPALVRSLDEQRSPKAKLAVIQFANNSFNKHTINYDGYSNNGFLKLWLAKLLPLVNDKNIRLKEASISGIISVYSHFDAIGVLNFILSLSVEEQNLLRRKLKQYTPRIEVELMNFLQNKKERQRSKSFYDQSNVGTSEEGYVGGIHCAYYSACSVDGEGERKRTSTEQLMQFDVYTIHATSDESHHPSQNVDACTSDPSSQGRLVTNSLLKTNYSIEHENSLLTPRLDVSELISCDGHKTIDMNHVSEVCRDPEMNHNKLNFSKSNLEGDMGPSIPGLLHQICNVNDASSSSEKCDTLQQLAEISLKNDNSVWAKYFDQILTAVLEVFDHSDPLMRELALSVIVRMLDNQKSAMEDSIDVVTEKLIHASKDEVAKVSNEANQCLNIILTRFDPYKFLSVIVPLLVSNDEKSLVICINCLTKIVGRLPQEDLMQHLPSFLPALFDAFGNQSPDLRKTVVFGLVEIYIILGKSFVPYLEGLSSTQLRLVTIYANRISQARSGASLNSCH